MPDAITEIEHDVVATPAADSGNDVEPAPEPVELVEADLLVEDVSIDGMCGVY